MLVSVIRSTSLRYRSDSVVGHRLRFRRSARKPLRSSRTRVKVCTRRGQRHWQSTATIILLFPIRADKMPFMPRTHARRGVRAYCVRETKTTKLMRTKRRPSTDTVWYDFTRLGRGCACTLFPLRPGLVVRSSRKFASRQNELEIELLRRRYIFPNFR